MNAVLAGAPFVPWAAGFAAAAIYGWFTRYRPRHQIERGGHVDI